MVVAAFVISIISLIAAAAAVWYTRSQAIASHRVANIEAERRAEERDDRARLDDAAKHANLRLTIEATSSRSVPHELVLTNHGPAHATEVSLEIVGTVGDGDPGRLLSEPVRSHLYAGEDFGTKIIRHMGAAPGVQCSVKWKDLAGEHTESMEAHFP